MLANQMEPLAAIERTEGFVDYQRDPSRYRHWRVAFEGAIATITMDVDEDGGIQPGYRLKLNSYDLGSTSSCTTSSSA